MAAPVPPLPLDLSTVLTESKRIINAHSRHFLALSVFFLLPPSFSLTVYPTLHSLLTQSSSHNSKIRLSSYVFVDQIQNPSHLLTSRTLLLSLLFAFFVAVFALLAIGSLTCSVLHGFYGRPVKLVSAVKSAFTSFFPLLITVVFSQIIVSALIFVTGFSFFLVIQGIELLGFQFDYSSPYFIGFSVAISIVLLLVIVYLQLNCSLAGIIVVVESSWGFEPLKRSTFLIKRMRGVALALQLFFVFLGGVLLLVSTASGLTLGIGTNNGWKSSAFVLQIVLTSTLLMLLLLYNVAANTVLYMYCKATHGELVSEIAEEFAREYVSLPFDDGKVPHLISVAYT
ncbi:uncharacterized protein [Euphorbia lathyris]|uniref:uncharacterized protein n=1 Tax=Euphorbia lathyris TaxID=212925 RepID=UPI003314142D